MLTIQCRAEDLQVLVQGIVAHNLQLTLYNKALLVILGAGR